ncbi:macro domain-containing protein [Flaviaesturariibacter terrae]
MTKNRWKYLFQNNWKLLLQAFFLVFGTIWLSIECPSALSVDVKEFVDSLDPWALIISVFASLIAAICIAFPKTSFTKQFKSAQTSISLRVGDLLEEDEDIVIGSSDFFDFSFNQTTGVSVKSQLISRLFNNDVDFINNQIDKSLEGKDHIALWEENKPFGRKFRYPVGTVAVLQHPQKRVFVVVLTKLSYQGKEKQTQSDPILLNQALNGLWEKIGIEGRKKKFSIPVLGAGLGNVNLSHLLIVQSIILSYAIFARRSRISREMSIVISPKDYNPSDFEEAIQFMKSLQI